MQPALRPTLAVFTALLIAAPIAAAQGQEAASPAAAKKMAGGPATEVELAIRKAAGDFAEAFNRGDAAAVAACWTEDGDYIDEDGNRYQGREEIQKAYASFFADHPGVQMRIVVDSVRPAGADTAIEDGRASLGPFPQVAPSFSRYTAVHVKQGGKWQMASVRDSRLQITVGPERLAELAWLEGVWTAARGDTNIKVEFRWLPGKHFLIKTSTLQQGQDAASTTLEVIGWDPLRGQLSSWSFSSDGGHALGTWAPHSPGWVVESTGASLAGTPTHAVNHLAKRSGDELVWQSVGRSAGDQSLPDTGQVILRRQAPGKN